MKKIALIQLLSKGDCLLSTTIAKQIKKDYPNSHLTWVVSKQCSDILEGNTDIDNFLEIEAPLRNATLQKISSAISKIDIQNYDKVFLTQPNFNIQNYDGNIRNQIFNAYPHKITVNKIPILNTTKEEEKKVATFVTKHSINQYQQIVLFEYAPQSGQIDLNIKKALHIANQLVVDKNVVVVLSGINSFDSPSSQIIDASSLTYRENAVLSYYCTLMIGCSSGISWLCTSTAAKQDLPMIQLLDPIAMFCNSMSEDFKRHGFLDKPIIQILSQNMDQIVPCVQIALKDFEQAKQQFHQERKINFRTTRKIVYLLFVSLKWGLIKKHIRYNVKEYGQSYKFWIAVWEGIFFSPFFLLTNRIRKLFHHHFS